MGGGALIRAVEPLEGVGICGGADTPKRNEISREAPGAWPKPSTSIVAWTDWTFAGRDPCGSRETAAKSR